MKHSYLIQPQAGSKDVGYPAARAFVWPGQTSEERKGAGRYGYHCAPDPKMLLHFPMQIQPPKSKSSLLEKSGQVSWSNGKKLSIHRHAWCSLCLCVISAYIDTPDVLCVSLCVISIHCHVWCSLSSCVFQHTSSSLMLSVFFVCDFFYCPATVFIHLESPFPLIWFFISIRVVGWAVNHIKCGLA